MWYSLNMEMNGRSHFWPSRLGVEVNGEKPASHKGQKAQRKVRRQTGSTRVELVAENAGEKKEDGIL